MVTLRFRNIFTAVFNLVTILLVGMLWMLPAHSAEEGISAETQDDLGRIAEKLLKKPSVNIGKTVFITFSPSMQPVVRLSSSNGENNFIFSEPFVKLVRKNPSAKSIYLMIMARVVGYKVNGSDHGKRFVGNILAQEGLSRNQIESFSKYIRDESKDWYPDVDVQEILDFHKTCRKEFLAQRGVMSACDWGAEPENTEESVNGGNYAPEIPSDMGQESGIVDNSDDLDDEGTARGTLFLERPSEKKDKGNGNNNSQGPGANLGRSALGAPAALMAAQEKNNSVVMVYYATNRKKEVEGAKNSNDMDPNEFYGALREKRNKLHYGHTLVNIPKVHVYSQIERPANVLRLEFWKKPKEDPDKHIMVTSVVESSEKLFFNMLGKDAKELKTAYVFVHGFNVSFASASRVAAQLSFDSKYTGATILFSWPSDGTLLNPTSYVSDTDDAIEGGQQLKKFLFQLVEKAGFDVINLVSHSMGNLAMTEALTNFQRELHETAASDEYPNLKGLVGQGDFRPFRDWVMYAPDVDVDKFARHEKYVKKVASRIHVYASDNDKAIKFSAAMRSAPRLGGYVKKFENGVPNKSCGTGVMYLSENVESVDATNLDLGFFSPLNHSYFSSKVEFIEDFREIMSGVEKISRRTRDNQYFFSQDNISQSYWEFYPSCK